jgi:hypothetical protein
MGPPGFEDMTRPQTPIDKRPEAMRVWLLANFRVSIGAKSIGDEEWHLRNAASLVRLLARGH